MRKVSNEKLEELKIYHIGTKMYPNKYYCDTLNKNIMIPEYYSIEDILKLIYDDAFELGVIEGKKQRSKEFRKLLEDESVI